MSGVTLCVTSCGRPDLLRQTLDSLLAHNRFDDKWLIEDAGDRRVADYLDEVGWGKGVILNEARLGQMRSIDRLYAEVATPYIFHCEDDWLFNPVDLLPACNRVLDAEPDVSCVSVRKLSDLPPVAHKRLERRQAGDVHYAVVPLDAHPEWFGFTFNPGLSRLSLWQHYGPYAELGSEVRISLKMKRDGLTCAFLDPGACHHIGAEAHVADPFQAARPKGLFGRLKRSLRKRADRLARRFGADR